MNKTMKLIGTGSIGVVCFIYITFSIIHMARVNSKMDEWNESYKTIEEDVSAFTKVSDPKTIRLYVKELNKILDEIHFLSKIVKSGQLADESLTKILNDQTIINQKLLNVVTLEEYRYNQKRQELNTAKINSFHDKVDFISNKIEQDSIRLAIKFESIRVVLDSIKTKLIIIRDSKINKFW